MSCPEIGLQREWDKMGQEKSRKEVVEEYLAGGVTLREMAGRYGLKRTTLHRWIKAEESGEGRAGVVANRSEAMKAMKAMPKDMGRLQRELHEARLEAKLYKAMIEIAEEQMGVQIRKKRGARQ
jgi:transposase